MRDMDTLIERIDARLAELGISRSRASLMAGLNVKFILSIAKHPNRSPRAENLEALAKVLGVPVEWLIRGHSIQAPKGSEVAHSDGVPIGHAGATAAVGQQHSPELQGEALPPQDAHRAFVRGRSGIPVLSGRTLSSENVQNASDIIEYIDISEKFDRIRDVFALYVEDDSMFPAYRAGDLIVLHPGRPPRSGDDAVFVVPGGNEFDDGNSQLEDDTVIASIASVGGEGYQLRQYAPARDFSLRRSDIDAVYLVMAVLRG